MRFFPSARWTSGVRSRIPRWAHLEWLATALAVVVALAGLAVPLASAEDRDDLKQRQSQVRGQIKDVKGEIQEASRRVARIARHLRAARVDLSSARTRLRAVRGELRTARVVAARLAVRLRQAEAQLAVAEARLAEARKQVALQRELTRDTVIGIATSGDARLALVAAYAESGSIEEVLLNRTAYDMVVGRENQVLGDLVAAEAAMEEHEATVQRARDHVALAKKAADANVATVRALVTRAARTKNQVVVMVVRTARARRAVVRARAADRAALRRLEQREARIKARIVRLSRKASGNFRGDTDGLLARPGPGPVTSPYGYRRHPIYGYYGLHNGIDFGTGCGANLWAGEAGTVVSRYYDEVYGNRLYLAIGRVNGATLTLVYNHLSSYRVGDGERVRRGEVVGYSGMTGWSTGCHLHFTVLRNGEPVDPAPYL